eukprot:scaffold37640_cov83-Cyclotella_meneghiniana.AAC.2
MDAIHGYHQLRVDKESQEKLAFAGPDAIKWTFLVMPFGPVNGPAIFIGFMHDMQSRWMEIAAAAGIDVSSDAGDRLIVDDILSFARTLPTAFAYLECQLQVCRAQNLSLSLKKCHFFPSRAEYTGIDIEAQGNRPAQSKHQLLRSWPAPELVRDVASFIGFAIFYSQFIPLFEIRISRLRQLTSLDYMADVKPHWDERAQAEWDDIRDAILSDPCLRRFNHNLRVYLLTDFCKDGFGYTVCQPGSDDSSVAAMRREDLGGECEFLRPNAKLTLHPISFGCRRTRGNENRLHSHLGEGFAGDWAINKCRLYTWGRTFTWLTDCYALRFIMSYDGNNAAILRLQMRLMCWDMTIEHRPGTTMSSPDYLSRLGSDLCFDPLLHEYLSKLACFKSKDPPVSSYPMLPENMPGFRTPRQAPTNTATASVSSEDFDSRALSLVTSIFQDDSHGHGSNLRHVPVLFGCFDPGVDLTAINAIKPRHNSELVLAAHSLLHFTWAVYGFNSGHFISCFERDQLPFRITLAADPSTAGRACFKKFTSCRTILSGLQDVLHHVRSSGDNSALDGYVFHAHKLPDLKSSREFWQLQASVVIQLRTVRSLSIFVAFIPPYHDKRCVATFLSIITDKGWVTSDTVARFPTFGDSVDSSARVIIGVHSLTMSNVAPARLPTPPVTRAPPIATYVWNPFNIRQYAISHSKDSPQFDRDLADHSSPSCLRHSEPTAACDTTEQFKILYCLHRQDQDCTIQSGSEVVSLAHLSPPLRIEHTTNLFGNYYGIEFRCDDNVLVRAISPFEFTRMFQLSDELTYHLSTPTYAHLLEHGVPYRTSSSVFALCHDKLCAIREANVELFDPSSHSAPAALANVFVNGAIGTKLPDAAAWSRAYEADQETALILQMIANPALITQTNLLRLHHSLRTPLRRGLISCVDGMVIFREPLGMGSDSYCQLRLVPSSLRNIIFIAFHANPIGGHLSHVRTFRNIRLRYFWPGMYQQIKTLCSKCPGCALANRVTSPAKELTYGFPITAPFMVVHIDGYSAGSGKNFDGESTYLIAACGMTGFAVMEPVSTPDATGFAKCLMRILLRFGLCHTLVLDKASPFLGVFREVCALLQFNTHTISGENHNPMLIERINRFLNKGLRVMTNERDSVRVACEAILLLLYAWNAAPIPGTDLPRSLVAIGRVFSYPIDFSLSKHLELTSSPESLMTWFSLAVPPDPTPPAAV